MSIKKIASVIIFVFCLNTGHLYGQTFREWTLSDALESKLYTLYEGVYRESWPFFFVWHLNKVKALDKALLKATYDIDAVVDTLYMRKQAKDRVVVLAGNNILHSFGHGFWSSSMQNTVGGPEAYKYNLPKGYKDILNWFVYRDLRKKSISNYHALPLKKDYAIMYEEEQPAFNWEITDETISILGYACQKAETHYRGRNWTVWFCPEIPVDGGLWKFSGLPGLIMKAEDNEHFYSFSCVGLERTDENINLPTGITVRKLNRDKFRRVERQHYMSPLQNSDREMGYMIGSHLSAKEDNGTELLLFTPENYMHPYFPMERE